MKKSIYNVRVALTAAVLAGMGMTGCSSSEDEPKAPMVLSRSETEMVQAQSDFAIKLLKTISEENPGENVGFSPFCVQQMLSMLANGVATEDQSKFVQSFGVTDVAELNELNMRLNETLPSRDPKNVTVSIANGFWMNETYNFKPDFVKTMRENYKSESASYDFGSVNIANIANKWIADKTNNGIRGLIPGIYNRNSSAVYILANALYFNGKWKNRFDKKSTRELPFTDSYGKNSKDVPTLFNTVKIFYRGFDHYSMSSLSYGEDAYRMLIILPDEGYTPADILDELTGGKMEQGLKQMNELFVALFLPKFDTATRGEITENIGKAGVPLNTVSYGNACPAIGQVVAYQGFAVTVSEEGTEIKASGASAGLPTASVESPGSELHIDRPFIYAVYETSSNAILGLGIINDPVR